MMRTSVLSSLSLLALLVSGIAGATPLISLNDIYLDITDRNAVSQYGLSSDFGGSYKVTVNGAPDNLDLAAPLLTSISVGDVVTLTLAHSALTSGYNAFYFGDNPGSLELPGPIVTVYNNNGTSGSDPVNTPYDVTWVATDNLAAGTPLRWVSTTWPGSQDLYLISATVVPEPSSGLLLGAGLIALARRRKRLVSAS